MEEHRFERLSCCETMKTSLSNQIVSSLEKLILDFPYYANILDVLEVSLS